MKSTTVASAYDEAVPKHRRELETPIGCEVCPTSADLVATFVREVVATEARRRQRHVVRMADWQFGISPQLALIGVFICRRQIAVGLLWLRVLGGIGFHQIGSFGVETLEVLVE